MAVVASHLTSLTIQKIGRKEMVLTRLKTCDFHCMAWCQVEVYRFDDHSITEITFQTKTDSNKLFPTLRYKRHSFLLHVNVIASGYYFFHVRMLCVFIVNW